MNSYTLHPVSGAEAALWESLYQETSEGADLKTGNIQGNSITDYQPPTPPPTTGLHRYQFLVFLQGSSTITIPYKQNRNRDLEGKVLQKSQVAVSAETSNEAQAKEPPPPDKSPSHQTPYSHSQPDRTSAHH
ncbi:hypothetical protein A6R68_12408 [Neotoma lepida]|uniref:Phosphatidylethanolamine-binding protein 4 n=1 Tax=Neotoma lepida TaxID=56216 RepID=A0A1A6H3V2_NEOLE|nr:hypothetical protein A6R68_12408 [Neotoma lepida]